MAFWTYLLLCADGKYYTGHTDDLETRIGQHKSGLIKGFTSSRLPIKLMWAQDFPTRYEALDAELTVKGWSQAKKEALIRGDWESVSFFAKPPKERRIVPYGVSTSLATNGERRSDTNGSEDDALSTPFVSSEVETPLSQAQRSK